MRVEKALKLQTKRFLVATLMAGVISSASAANSNQTLTTESNSTETRQTESERRHLQWGLTENEYARYEQLMKGIRGSVSPETISPIEVLGIHARSDAERDRYAKIWADRMEEDAKRVLAFQRAYDKAWQEKGGQIIDIAALKQRKPAGNTNSNQAVSSEAGQGGALTFLTRLDGCPSCDSKIQDLMTSMLVDNSMRVNIYFSDSKGKENSLIRQWAVKNKVDPKWLQNKRITLNHGDSLMQRFQVEESQLPVVFK